MIADASRAQNEDLKMKASSISKKIFEIEIYFESENAKLGTLPDVEA